MSFTAPRPVVYRIIKTSNRTLRDFETDAERGKRPRNPSPEMLRRHRGRSVWLDLDHARDLARELPWLGSHIAEIELPASIELEPFAKDHLHATAYGRAGDLYDAVVRILPAR